MVRRARGKVNPKTPHRKAIGHRSFQNPSPKISISFDEWMFREISDMALERNISFGNMVRVLLCKALPTKGE